MSLTALALALGAGALHATWNLILKGASDRLLVAAWGLLAGAAIFSPALIAAWPVPASVWPFACASATVLLGYYACLARAYERGDFSLVYPVARGAAPALLTLWAALFLGERPSALGLAGIATILAGLAVVGGAPLWLAADAAQAKGGGSRLRALRFHARGAGVAFLVALLVSVYTAVDAAGVRHWSPLPYLVLVFALSGSVLVPLLALREMRAGRGAVAVEPGRGVGAEPSSAAGTEPGRAAGAEPGRAAGAEPGREGRSRALHVLRTDWLRIVAVAAMTLGAYALVLEAFRIAPVSYAGAVRESGVVFGALAGWLLLGERFGKVRAAGATLVFAGIALLAVR